MKGDGSKLVRQRNRLKYAPRARPNGAETLDISRVPLGQWNPQHCPQSEEGSSGTSSSEQLGSPLTIHEVAGLLGCSPWTVRQRLIPAGLPHFRASRAGKLVFFENQIVRWLLDRQREKGGYFQ